MKLGWIPTDWNDRTVSESISKACDSFAEKSSNASAGGGLSHHDSQNSLRSLVWPTAALITVLLVISLLMLKRMRVIGSDDYRYTEIVDKDVETQQLSHN